MGAGVGLMAKLRVPQREVRHVRELNNFALVAQYGPFEVRRMYYFHRGVILKWRRYYAPGVTGGDPDWPRG